MDQGSASTRLDGADPRSIGDIGILDNNQLANRPGISVMPTAGSLTDHGPRAAARGTRASLWPASRKLQASGFKLDICRLKDYIGYRKDKLC